MKKLLVILLFWSTAHAQHPGIIFVGSSVCTIGDADAQKYIDSVQLTTSLTCLQKQSIDTLFQQLKAASVYSSLFALTLHVWGAAAGNKWNAVNPSNTDAAFRVTYGSGLTYGSDGVTGNGSTGTANYHFNPSSSGWTTTSACMGIFVENNSFAGGPYDMGSTDDAGTGVGTNPSFLISRYSTNQAYGAIGNGLYTLVVAETDSRGSWIVSRNGAANTDLYKNGSSVATVAQTVILTSYDLFLWSVNAAGTAQHFSDKKIAVSFISSGLNSTQVAAVNTCIEYFLDKLSIGVQ